MKRFSTLFTRSSANRIVPLIAGVSRPHTRPLSLMRSNVPISVVAFDLDDTLHNFSAAAAMATSAVFQDLNRQHGLDTDLLRAAYKDISSRYVTSFTDGRTSHEYRTERMRALLERFSIYTSSRTEDCVGLYGQQLRKSLQLEAGAEQVLSALKKYGIKIAIVTEGPQDAQEQTIRDLSIDHHVDWLLTSNQERISKSQGLFKVFLDKTNTAVDKAIVVGDSLQNDVRAAEAVGLTAVHYAKKGGSPAELSIAHLQELIDRNLIRRPPEKKLSLG